MKLSDKQIDRVEEFAIGAFKSLQDQQPEDGQKVLVKSPDGVIYYSTYREDWGSFDCQSKQEMGDDWRWRKVFSTFPGL